MKNLKWGFWRFWIEGAKLHIINKKYIRIVNFYDVIKKYGAYEHLFKKSTNK